MARPTYNHNKHFRQQNCYRV